MAVFFTGTSGISLAALLATSIGKLAGSPGEPGGEPCLQDGLRVDLLGIRIRRGPEVDLVQGSMETILRICWLVVPLLALARPAVRGKFGRGPNFRGSD